MAHQAGEPIPDVIRDAPEPLPGLELYLDAYWEVQGDRPSGWSPGRIPWSTIVKFCEQHDLSGEQQDRMVYFFNRMDDAYLAYVAEQGKSGGK